VGFLETCGLRKEKESIVFGGARLKAKTYKDYTREEVVDFLKHAASENGDLLPPESRLGSLSAICSKRGWGPLVLLAFNNGIPVNKRALKISSGLHKRAIEDPVTRGKPKNKFGVEVPKKIDSTEELADIIKKCSGLTGGKTPTSRELRFLKTAMKNLNISLRQLVLLAELQPRSVGNPGGRKPIYFRSGILNSIVQFRILAGVYPRSSSSKVGGGWSTEHQTVADYCGLPSKRVISYYFGSLSKAWEAADRYAAELAAADQKVEA
jgi:hypothetical protein